MQTSPVKSWRLTEPAAEAYERHLVPALFAPWARRMVQMTAPRQGEQVLDIGCGTGIVARTAAPHVGREGRVVGLDSNDVMLAVARRIGDDGPVQWRQGDALDLPFEDGEFDVVMSSQVLPFVADAEGAASEMARVLAPGGRLAVASWRSIGHSPGWSVLADVLEEHVGAEAGMMMRAPFGGPQADSLRRMFAGAGLEQVRARIEIAAARYTSAQEMVRHEAAASPLAAMLDAMGPAAMDAMAADLQAKMQMHSDDDGVVFPMSTWVATARRPS